MTNKSDQLDELSEKLKILLKKQEVFSKEVNEIREEIIQLKISETIKHQKKGESFFNEEHVKEQPKYSPSSVSKKLYRDVDHRILGGVCSGLAEYLGINRALVRILWLFLTLFFGIGFLAYLILWIAIPKAGTTSTTQKGSQTIKCDFIFHKIA